MTEHHLVRGLLLRIGRGMPASAPIAKAILEWAQPHAGWLFADLTDPGEDLAWESLTARLEQPSLFEEGVPHVLQLAVELARLLDFDPRDTALLELMAACDRLPRVAALATLASRHGCDLPALLGELAGADPQEAERAVRCSAVLRLGLIGFVANRQGEVSVDVRWALERLLDRAPNSGPELIEVLVGARQTSPLAPDHFAHVADAGFLVRLLQGAVRSRAPGINVLIHGPPGTGKTELARVLAAAAGAALHGIGEADEDGEEPNRWDRVTALQLAQRVLGGRGEAVLLFDEMEDLIGNTQRSGGDWFTKREGSKVFVNRLLETNPVPVIWTTNAVGNVDGAILRRMSFVLKLDLPTRGAALRMLDRIAADEGVSPGAEFGALIEAAPETATVLKVAARAARLAEESDAGVGAARSLVCALRGGELPAETSDKLDLALFETDRAVEPLFAAMKDSGAADVSLLLSGPPGTGKTALAHQLARDLDRPLLVKRTSDLLSKWVGGTERNIAEAFAEARRREAVLLFDEADSLLFDRSTARVSWEVTQVNEMLTWLDRHPLPVVAATNHRGSLDPASLRRFVFKLDLLPLGPAKAAQAFERFFGLPAPAGLADLTKLTPGDFAVVARQLRHAPAVDAAEICRRLHEECLAKPEGGGRMGF